jgi:hypothetical protein
LGAAFFGFDKSSKKEYLFDIHIHLPSRDVDGRVFDGGTAMQATVSGMAYAGTDWRKTRP